jgi:hypothetical protein
MLDNIWAFVKDPANRAVLTWIGGGIVVVAGGLWAVLKFFTKGDDGDAKPSVKAEEGSVAIGGDNKKSPINIGARSRSKS